MTDRQWLHIQVLHGQLYVFADNGHWKDSPHCGWDKTREVTFNELAEDCLLGRVENGEFQFRIRINPPKTVTKYGKFGMPYEEEVTLPLQKRTYGSYLD